MGRVEGAEEKKSLICHATLHSCTATDNGVAIIHRTMFVACTLLSLMSYLITKAITAMHRPPPSVATATVQHAFVHVMLVADNS